MDRFTNAIKRNAAAMDHATSQPRWGIVTSVDPSRPAAKVLIQPENVQSGWLPIAAAAAGNGWGIVALPLPGDMAFLVPEAGGVGDYVIVGCAHNDAEQPPKPANTIGTGGTPSTGATQIIPGEICLVSHGGAVIRMSNAAMTIYLRGAVGIDGDLHVNGDVYDRHGSLDRLRGNYNAHIHTQGNDGHGDIEAPTNTTSNPDAE